MGQEERRSLWRGFDPLISPYSPNTFQDPPGPWREEEGQLPGVKKWQIRTLTSWHPQGALRGGGEGTSTSPFLVLNLQLEAGVRKTHPIPLPPLLCSFLSRPEHPRLHGNAAVSVPRVVLLPPQAQCSVSFSSPGLCACTFSWSPCLITYESL